jgi:hypothetical protein
MKAPTFGRLAAAASLLGASCLCFLAGAAAMHYRSPLSRPLADAFIGADVWFTGPPPDRSPAGRAPVRLRIDDAGLTSDGYTLWHTTEAAEAVLYDMRLNVVHRWTMPEVLAWPSAEGIRIPPGSTHMHWDCCRVLPNGDLLALCNPHDTPFGVGLARLDKSSRLLWLRAGPFHHDFDVAEDGRIFALTRRQKHRLPAGFEGLTEPYFDDILTILSPDGAPAGEVPLLETFRHSPYLVTLLSDKLTAPEGEAAPASAMSQLEMKQVLRMLPDGPRLPALPTPDAWDSPDRRAAAMDVLHTNGVRVLGKEMAGKPPMLRPGHVLLSMRTPSMLAVLDPQKRCVSWAARGPWRYQHDAQPLDNGRILLFDNLGSSRGSRVLEYDPATQAVPWAFPGPRPATLAAPYRGRCQRLPNGNTLAVEPMRRAIEVTPAGEVVWEAGFPPESLHPARNITGALRYRPEDLPFLKGIRDTGPR